MTGVPGHRYCIIGAGPAGLAQARAFKRRGVEFDVIERHRRLGGVWDIDNPGSPMYESAHFISSRTLSGFLGFPMPSGFPDYPRHDLILEYLRAFAETYGLVPHIQFGKAVERVTPTAEGAVVRVGGRDEHYAGVVCATGMNWGPSEIEVDEVLAATGFQVSLPYLDTAAVEWQGQCPSHFSSVFSRPHPGLFTLGFVELNGALYPHLDRLAALVAEFAHARAHEPATAARFRQLVTGLRLDLSGGTRYVGSPRHDFYCDNEALGRATLRVFRLAGWTPPSDASCRPSPASAAS